MHLIYNLQQVFVRYLASVRGASAHALVGKTYPHKLDGWLPACQASKNIAPATFGEGLRRDYAAVYAALFESWCSGQAEV